MSAANPLLCDDGENAGADFAPPRSPSATFLSKVILQHGDEYLKQPGLWSILCSENLSIPTLTDCKLHDVFLHPRKSAWPLIDTTQVMANIYASELYTSDLSGRKARWLLEALGVVYATQMLVASDTPTRSSSVLAAIVDPAATDDACVAAVRVLDTIATKIREQLTGFEPIQPHDLMIGRHAQRAIQEYDCCRLRAIYQPVTPATPVTLSPHFVKHTPSLAHSGYEKVTDEELERAKTLFCSEGHQVYIAGTRRCVEQMYKAGLANLVNAAKLDVLQLEYARVRDCAQQTDLDPAKSLKVYQSVDFMIVSIVASEGSDQAWLHVAKRTREVVKRGAK